MVEALVAVQGDKGERCYCLAEHTERYDPIIFDTKRLADRLLISGTPRAGRGNAAFFSWFAQPMVLRHYRRGGLVRHFSDNRYFFTGIQRTRCVRELSILQKLQSLGLPAARPFACRVRQHGPWQYSGSIVIFRVEGNTLAEQLCSARADNALWQHIGEVIATFHRHGVYHADLNAHNIIVSSDDGVSLIDFDRACFRKLPRPATGNGWCLQNLNRLQRSVEKLAKGNPAIQAAGNDIAVGLSQLRQSWRNKLID